MTNRLLEERWASVLSAIDEIEWYASRRINLDSLIEHNPERIWAQSLEDDIKDLRRYVDQVRAFERSIDL